MSSSDKGNLLYYMICHTLKQSHTVYGTVLVVCMRYHTVYDVYENLDLGVKILIMTITMIYMYSFRRHFSQKHLHRREKNIPFCNSICCSSFFIRPRDESVVEFKQASPFLILILSLLLTSTVNCFLNDNFITGQLFVLRLQCGDL